MMAYERITRIQQESPYAVEEVVEVEHVVHDYRLYIGMWIVAGVSAVATFLTFSVACLIITIVALAFALPATPGRQKKS
jgi:Na+(H+)/acetate symporter ActP